MRMKKNKNNGLFKDILYSGLISFTWLFYSKEKANNNRELQKVLSEYERKYMGDILNPGTLIAFSYLIFVFPKESNFITFEEDQTKHFSIFKNEKTISCKSDEVIRHLRNAIAHANIDYHSKEMLFIFKDKNMRNNDIFEIQISLNNFKEFLVKIMSSGLR